ncbi:FAD-dependent oxidoreductase [Streptomyces sp. NPDC058045]|uniref:FAD-dependent oxidoreductase n=1 Tax=Streptomyces sp. NPDC058045 TaxID=3346311 RepID=UPI0036E3FC66
MRDVLVVGGGLLGPAVAGALRRAAPGAEVTVLTGEPAPGGGPRTGLVHSGVGERPGTLGARCAVRGAVELRAFCAEHGLPFAATGELVVAGERAELPRLHALAQRARSLGLPVAELGRSQLTTYEPEIRGRAALRVASAGLCDLAAVARRLTADCGAEVRHGERVVRVERPAGRGVAVRTAEGAVHRARVLIDCTDMVARPAAPPLPRPARTAYVVAGVRGPVSPLPAPGSLYPAVYVLPALDGAEGDGVPAYSAEARAAVARLLPSAAAAGGVPGDGGLGGDVRIEEGPRTVLLLGGSSPSAALPLCRELADRALRLLARHRPRGTPPVPAAGTGERPPPP